MAIRITGTADQFRPIYEEGPNAGEVNPHFLNLVRLFLERYIDNRGGTLSMPVDESPDEMGLAKVKSYLDDGFEVEGYPCFALMTPSQYNGNVPSYMHGATDGVGDPITWVSWNSAFHYDNGSVVRYLMELNGRGQVTKGSVLKQLYDDGYVLKSLGEAREFIADNLANFQGVVP